MTPTQPYPRNYVVPVGAGQDGKWWAFDHSEGVNSNNFVRFENCPDVFCFDPKQGMVPSGLDGHF